MDSYILCLGRPRRVWEDNIRMDLKEIGVHTIDSAQKLNFRIL